MARTLTAAALICAVALPAAAHTDQELADWHHDWHRRVDQAGGTLSQRLLAERADWMRRHPCRTVIDSPCPAPRPDSNASPTRSPGIRGGEGMGSGVEQWRGLVEAYFGDATDAALRVMACESGGNPNAYNPSGASGLFQMMPIWHRTYGGDPFDPADNVAMAWSLYRDSGHNWSHWACRP